MPSPFPIRVESNALVGLESARTRSSLPSPLKSPAAIHGRRLARERVHMRLKSAIAFSQQHRNAASLGETGGGDIYISVAIKVAGNGRVRKL